MTSQARPVHVAEAIVEAAREQVANAYRYQSAWGSLTRAGVPRLDTRHVLDRHAETTAALGHVERWCLDGARGLLGLAGERGAGKTFAAAWWFHRRHERGRWGRWVECASWGRMNWNELRALLTAAEKAPALVLDDLTAGQTSKRDGAPDHFHAAINGLLLERIGSMRPTLICANGDAGTLAGWLDPRVFDRLTLAGAIPELPTVPSLRKPDLEQVDEQGRGVEWHRTDALVRMFGCERTREFDKDRGHYVDVLDIGRDLIRAAQLHKHKPCVEAVELAGLDREAIRIRAQEIGGSDTRGELEEQLEAARLKLHAAYNVPGIVKGYGYESEKAQADNIRRSNACHAAANSGRRLAPEAMHSVVKVKLMPWTQGKDGLGKLESAGFKVEGRHGAMRLLYNDSIMATGLPSKAAAWDRAREIASMGW